MTESFFHAGENCLVVAGLNIDHAVCRQSCLSDCWSEKVGPCDAPQHLALGAGSDTGAKQRGRGTVDRPVAAARYFVQCA
ncbi:hypothetical protein BN961_04045 [Afipia felis]|uniref:Uncharacterized protein n=1 Tax=Afipia felis TaxID=1035 RepID=A0A090MTC0_AFIFE|nr:hypothetical protein BN961_04045 [Afipia felis]